MKNIKAREIMEKNEKNNKQVFSDAWKKVGDWSKKTADGAKKIVDQTKENIHEREAKKYQAISKEMFSGDDFQIPTVLRIEDDSANRDFIEDSAIGWIEIHRDEPVLHMYTSFVKESGIAFVPVSQRDNVYCQDNFDNKKYINANQIFGKATEEKLAELNYIAYSLGAKSCSVEIIEAETECTSRRVQIKVKGNSPVSNVSINESVNKQSGKSVSFFEGHDNPKVPTLKWFAHDDNIRGLIEMRCNKAIKSNILELKGSSSATMSRKTACAIDALIKTGGSMSMEKQSEKEHNNRLLFEIEF